MLVYSSRISVSVATNVEGMVNCRSGSVPVSAQTKRMNIVADTGATQSIKQVR